jgi:hypothetical protein
MRHFINCAVLSGVLFSASLFSAYGQMFGVNLLTNGDAEAGQGSPPDEVVEEIPGWTTFTNITVIEYGAPGGFPVPGDGPPYCGANFFAGGPDNDSSSVTQIVDISSIAGAVDSGNLPFVLSGYLGGYGSQDDNATFTATFCDGSNAPISSVSIGPVLASDRTNETGMFFRSNTGSVPAGTRNVVFTLLMTRSAEFYNDGYADSLSFVLGQSVPQIHLAISQSDINQVQLCWNTVTNGAYQLEYCATLETNCWVPFTTNFIIGVDGIFCTNDVIVPDEPRRFYRVVSTNGFSLL